MAEFPVVGRPLPSSPEVSLQPPWPGLFLLSITGSTMLWKRMAFPHFPSTGCPAIVSGKAMLSAFYNKEKFIEEMHNRQKLGITD